jgi:hypothetical protein
VTVADAKPTKRTAGSQPIVHLWSGNALRTQSGSGLVGRIGEGSVAATRLTASFQCQDHTVTSEYQNSFGSLGAASLFGPGSTRAVHRRPAGHAIAAPARDAGLVADDRNAMPVSGPHKRRVGRRQPPRRQHEPDRRLCPRNRTAGRCRAATCSGRIHPSRAPHEDGKHPADCRSARRRNSQRPKTRCR